MKRAQRKTVRAKNKLHFFSIFLVLTLLFGLFPVGGALFAFGESFGFDQALQEADEAQVLDLAEEEIGYSEDGQEAKEEIELLSERVFSNVETRAVLHEGISGGCTWSIDDQGELLIRPTDNISGQMSSWTSMMFVPWDNYRTSIESVRFAPGTKAPANMTHAFAECPNLTTVSGFENLDTSELESMRSFFMNCDALTSIDLTGLDTSNVTNMGNLFYRCGNLESVNFTGFDTSNVTLLTTLFVDCVKLTSVDISGFDVSSATSISSMFEGCTGLTSLKLPKKFATANMKNVSSVFERCSGLTEIDISESDTSSVTNFQRMFKDCNALTTLKLPQSFVTEKATRINELFEGCVSLASIDASGWVTTGASLVSMTNLFKDCASITTLDLSGFDMSSAYPVSNMFTGCSSLNKITLGPKFSFLGDEDGTSCQLYTPTQPANVTYTGKWIAQSNGAKYDGDKIPNKVADTYIAEVFTPPTAQYKIKFFYQLGGSYDRIITEKGLTGTTGAYVEVSEEDKIPDGDGGIWVLDNDEPNKNKFSGYIAGDGSLELEVYFKQQFVVTYAPGIGGAFENVVHEDLDYGENTPAPPASPQGNPGYVFAGWNPSLKDNIEGYSSWITYTAQWTREEFVVSFFAVDRAGKTLSEVEPPLQQTGYYYDDPYELESAISEGKEHKRVYVGWKEGKTGTFHEASIPIEGTIQGSTEVYLVYGHDHNQDGEEDALVTRKWVEPDGQGGFNIISDLEDSFIAEQGALFSRKATDDPAPSISEKYTYAGYAIKTEDGPLDSTTIPGSPSFPVEVSRGDCTIYYVYQSNDPVNPVDPKKQLKPKAGDNSPLGALAFSAATAFAIFLIARRTSVPHPKTHGDHA